MAIALVMIYSLTTTRNGFVGFDGHPRMSIAFQSSDILSPPETMTPAIAVGENDDLGSLGSDGFVADTNKILLNEKDCMPKADEILVCGNSDIDTRYRIENRQSLRDLPRDHRSWTDVSERLQDNADRNRNGSYSSSGFFGGRTHGIKNLRDRCEQGASEAQDKNTQARAIAEISQNQTSAPPKREKGPCEF